MCVWYGLINNCFALSINSFLNLFLLNLNSFIFPLTSSAFSFASWWLTMFPSWLFAALPLPLSCLSACHVAAANRLQWNCLTKSEAQESVCHTCGMSVCQCWAWLEALWKPVASDGWKRGSKNHSLISTHLFQTLCCLQVLLICHLCILSDRGRMPVCGEELHLHMHVHSLNLAIYSCDNTNRKTAHIVTWVYGFELTSSKSSEFLKLELAGN